MRGIPVVFQEELARYAIKTWKGEIEDVKEWLQRVGNEIVLENEDEVIIKSVSGMATGLTAGTDPICAGVIIAMAMFGIFWAAIMPEYLKIIDKMWKQERKKQKTKSFAWEEIS